MKVVLLAEDEEGLLESLASIVEGMGHRALTADNGEDALKLAREKKPDLVVSDYMMPRRNGLDLLRALRSDSDPDVARTPFVLVSAARPQRIAADYQFISKPLGLDQFEKAVTDALETAPPKAGGLRTELTREQESALSLAREEMFNWVAHEIKTPLSSARMNAELIERHLKSVGEGSQVKRAEVVLKQIDRMEALVNSVLEAARLAEGRVVLKKERRDLRELVAAVVTGWRDARQDLQFGLSIGNDPALADFDPERVRQILDNLISNAAKYGQPSPRVEVDVATSETTIEVRVRDFGPGITAAELPLLFNRFHRGDSTGGGHGLGLFISSALARFHGGSIRAESEPADGSTFTLILPRAI
jgi:signal transduction histidine kinase